MLPSKVPTPALTAQRYRIRRRISQLRFLDSALLQPVCEVGRRRIVALRDELLGEPVGEHRLDFRTVLVQLAFAGVFRPSDRQAGRPSRAKGFLRPRGDQPPLDLSGHWGSLHKSDIIVRLARTFQEHLSRTRSFRIRSAKSHPRKLGGAKSMIYTPFQ